MEINKNCLIMKVYFIVSDKIDDDQKQITIEKLSEDIRLYFNMITSFTEKRARARQMVNILFHADRRSFKGFAYLF